MEKDLDAANIELAKYGCEQLKVQELGKLSNNLFEYPTRYIDVIEIMRNRDNELLNTKLLNNTKEILP